MNFESQCTSVSISGTEELVSLQYSVNLVFNLPIGFSASLEAKKLPVIPASQNTLVKLMSQTS